MRARTNVSVGKLSISWLFRNQPAWDLHYDRDPRSLFYWKIKQARVMPSQISLPVLLSVDLYRKALLLLFTLKFPVHDEAVGYTVLLRNI